MRAWLPTVSPSATLALLALFPVVTAAQGRAVQARPDFTYFVDVHPARVTLCPRERVNFTVRIGRDARVNGQLHTTPVAGGTILGTISSSDIGHFEGEDFPNGIDVIVGPPPEAEASFQFVADRRGTTKITFDIRFTGEGRRFGERWPRKEGIVNVEVVNCWEAYTSGLGTTFSTKYIGKFDTPFRLEGRIAAGGVAGVTQIMRFTPDPQNRLTGSYTFMDRYWVSNRGGRCVAFVSGFYDVVFYPDENNAVEGDMLMGGSGTAFCDGSTVNINYAESGGFQIGIKPGPGPVLTLWVRP